MSKNFETKNKYKHFKSKSHIEFDGSEQIILSQKDSDLIDVDKAVYLYVIKHIRNFEYYLIEC